MKNENVHQQTLITPYMCSKQQENRSITVLQELDRDAQEDIQDFSDFEAVQTLRQQEEQNAVEEMYMGEDKGAGIK